MLFALVCLLLRRLVQLITALSNGLLDTEVELLVGHCCIGRQAASKGRLALMRSDRCRHLHPVPRSAFAGFRFPPEVITLAVRWYLRFGLSYRDVEELLAERGIEVDHVSIYRWVQRFAPEFAEAARTRQHVFGDRWHVDETYVKVGGTWRYLFRAIDQFGQVIDPVESAIIVAQSGLELLGWLQFVESGRVSSSDWNDPRLYPAHRKIRELIALASVNPAVPARFPSLIGLDPSWQDSPPVVAGVQNRLVHPRSAGGRVGWPASILIDAWLLSSYYLELSLLHAMGVQSPIRDRLGSSPNVGATVKPP